MAVVEHLAEVKGVIDGRLGIAEIQGGLRRGRATGGRIVAEVLLGLLELDSQSFLRLDPTWTPPEGRRTVGELLTFAVS